MPLFPSTNDLLSSLRDIIAVLTSQASQRHEHRRSMRPCAPDLDYHNIDRQAWTRRPARCNREPGRALEARGAQRTIFARRLLKLRATTTKTNTACAKGRIEIMASRYASSFASLWPCAPATEVVDPCLECSKSPVTHRDPELHMPTLHLLPEGTATNRSMEHGQDKAHAERRSRNAVLERHVPSLDWRAHLRNRPSCS